MKHTCPAIQINPPKQVCWGDIIGEIDNQQDLIDKITQMMDLRDEINFNADNPVGTVVISETERTFRFGTWELIDGGYYIGATKNASKVGTKTNAGLPNIEGSYTIELYNKSNKPTGAYKQSTFDSGSRRTATGGSHGWGTIKFNASDSNSIYGNSNTVTPKTVWYYIYKRVS